MESGLFPLFLYALFNKRKYKTQKEKRSWDPYTRISWRPECTSIFIFTQNYTTVFPEIRSPFILTFMHIPPCHPKHICMQFSAYYKNNKTEI